MFTGFTHLHSTLRYLIIVAALWTLIKLAMGLNSNKKFRSSDRKPGLIFLILMDLQLLIGGVLYFLSPWAYASVRNYGMGGVMRSAIPRFYAIEHAVGMIIALVLVHIAYSITKKEKLNDKTKFTRAFILFFIAFLFIISFIPWPFRAELGKGWF